LLTLVVGRQPAPSFPRSSKLATHPPCVCPLPAPPAKAAAECCCQSGGLPSETHVVAVCKGRVLLLPRLLYTGVDGGRGGGHDAEEPGPNCPALEKSPTNGTACWCCWGCWSMPGWMLDANRRGAPDIAPSLPPPEIYGRGGREGVFRYIPAAPSCMRAIRC
ncbi:unnamed protein product, partial [Scytosiphon promiscuus]